MSGHISEASYRQLFDEISPLFTQLVDKGLSDVIKYWDIIYGIKNEAVIKQVTEELETKLKDFWEQQSTSLADMKNSYLKKIEISGREAVLLEKALDLNPEVMKLPSNTPLAQMDEQFQSLLEKYQDLKEERLRKYSQMQKLEKELCSTLDLKPPKYEYDMADKYENECTQSFVPSSAEMEEIAERIHILKQDKENVEYQIEDLKFRLNDLMTECDIRPLTKEERFCFDLTDLSVTKMNLNILKELLKKYTNKKNEMMEEATHLKNEIDRLSKKMFKNKDEIEEFLSAHSGFTVSTITKLKDKLKELKEERKQNLKELIVNSRIQLKDLWTRCCVSEDEQDKFTAFNTTRVSEEVLEIHELEIEKLEDFYIEHKKIFSLAARHQELWSRLLQLEEQANNKDRLFNNRGGCLLKEEKERKLIQKQLPAIKSQLFELLEAYKDSTGKDFTLHGKPLAVEIETKEQMREISKQQERMLRKNANAENIANTVRYGGTHVSSATKRKAVTPKNPKSEKSRRMETMSSACSSGSSTNTGTLVQKEVEKSQYHGQTYLTVRTPQRRIPASSTPQNGSLSYESFQEHLALNSTKNTEKQRVLRPKNLNQTHTLVERITPYKTPKTPGKTTTKTPSKTPSRIPFRIPTGSKIPSKVPPISPRKKTPTLSTTKLPIIF